MGGELNRVSYSDPSTVKKINNLTRQICIDIILHYNIKILKELLISFWAEKKTHSL